MRARARPPVYVACARAGRRGRRASLFLVTAASFKSPLRIYTPLVTFLRRFELPRPYTYYTEVQCNECSAMTHLEGSISITQEEASTVVLLTPDQQFPDGWIREPRCKDILKCRFCIFRGSKSAVIAHMRDVHKQSTQSVVKCSTCPFTTVWGPPALRRHMRSQHLGYSSSRCEPCAITYITVADKRAHEVSDHDTKDDIQCDHCGKHCRDRARLRRHEKYVHPLPNAQRIDWSVRLLACCYCDFKTHHKLSLKKHTARFHDDTVIQRRRTWKWRRNRQQQIRQELALTQKEPRDKQKTITIRKVYECTLCTFTSSHRSSWYRHVKGIHKVPRVSLYIHDRGSKHERENGCVCVEPDSVPPPTLGLEQEGEMDPLLVFSPDQIAEEDPCHVVVVVPETVLEYRVDITPARRNEVEAEIMKEVSKQYKQILHSCKFPDLYKCTLCAFKTAYTCSVKRHLKRHFITGPLKAKRLRESQQTYYTPLYACTKCDFFVSPYKANLARHITSCNYQKMDPLK
jgi:hypothetical protein